MREQQSTTEDHTVSEQYGVVEQCRAAFMADIARQFINQVTKNKDLPTGMNRNVLKQTEEQLARCVREIRRTTPEHQSIYLDRNLKFEKMLDIATTVFLVARIGIEEKDDIYEEFFGLIIDVADQVFYAQENRKKMHFGKYKALFKMLANEIKADVNRQQGQVLYTTNGDLYLRTTPSIPSPEIS